MRRIGVAFTWIAMAALAVGSAAATADEVARCVDMLTEQLDRAGRLRRMAEVLASGTRLRGGVLRTYLSRAVDAQTTEASLDRIVGHLQRIGASYVRVGPRSASNLASADEALRKASSWTGFGQIGDSLTPLILVDDPYVLLIDLTEETEPLDAPEVAYSWSRINRVAERRSLITPSRVVLFATYQTLGSPGSSRMPTIFERDGRVIYFELLDLTDRQGRPRSR